MTSKRRTARKRVNCILTQTQITPLQKSNSKKSVVHMKCCQTQMRVPGMTDLGNLVLVVQREILLVVAAGWVTSSKRFSAVEDLGEGANLQDHLVDKILKSRHALT
jgi:hypothetical protein